jgi:asparagine synthase (glutamine-hydrolysing)
MCGLFGWVKFQECLSSRDLAQARDALSSLSHRGPDAVGEWAESGVYMGHRRLSIIDLSDSASQPMHDGKGRWVLVYNGEIYNFLELRRELEAEGRRFRTVSDTEVLLAVLSHHGIKGLSRLDGMFAGALHDRQTGRHLLFRDNLGQKPLYCAVRPDEVVYASELRALLSLQGFEWRIDRGAFRRYLANSYYTWDNTPIVGVRKLLPGTAMVIKGGQVSTESWWESKPGSNPLDIGYDQALDEFDKLFDRSCHMTLRADVPLGIMVSGGIDSTLVLDSCRRAAPDVLSFSVAMGERDYDESAKAAAAVAQAGGRNHIVCTMDADNVVSNLDGFLAVADEPHGDPGFVNALFLSQEMRRHVTVALGGDGADELFYGYIPFAGVKAESLLARLPDWATRAAGAAVGLLPGSDRYVGLQFKARAYLQAFPAPAQLRAPLWLATLPPDELARLLPRSARMDERGAAGLFAEFYTLMDEIADHSPAQRMAWFYQRVFLPEFVCHHTDRAAMRHGLEVRTPFLSPALIDFANRVPDDFKAGDGRLKRLLRDSLLRRGYKPEIWGQKKQGFTFPLARWLKTSLRPRLDTLIAGDDDFGGEVDFAVLAALVSDHLSGRRNNYRILYNLIVFSAWRRQHPTLSFE